MEVSDYLGLAGAPSNGDLRVPHFMELHALQVLPLIAFALSLSDGYPRMREFV
jgi:hypothetical protein